MRTEIKHAPWINQKCLAHLDDLVRQTSACDTRDQAHIFHSDGVKTSQITHSNKMFLRELSISAELIILT